MAILFTDYLDLVGQLLYYWQLVLCLFTYSASLVHCLMCHFISVMFGLSRASLLLLLFLFSGPLLLTRHIHSTGTSLLHFLDRYLLHIPSFWWVSILFEWLTLLTHNLFSIESLPQSCTPDECITNWVITKNAIILLVFVQWKSFSHLHFL